MKLPLTVEVEMELFAKVTITQEICDCIANQYPESWERIKNDPEEIIKMILYARESIAMEKVKIMMMYEIE